MPTPLQPSERQQLRALEARVAIALEAASAGRTPAPEALRELLLDTLSRLQALGSGSWHRPGPPDGIARNVNAAVLIPPPPLPA